MNFCWQNLKSLILKHVSSGANAIPNSAVNNRNVEQTTDSSFVGVDQSFSTERLEKALDYKMNI